MDEGNIAEDDDGGYDEVEYVREDVDRVSCVSSSRTSEHAVFPPVSKEETTCFSSNLFACLLFLFSFIIIIYLTTMGAKTIICT